MLFRWVETTNQLILMNIEYLKLLLFHHLIQEVIRGAAIKAKYDR